MSDERSGQRERQHHSPCDRRQLPERRVAGVFVALPIAVFEGGHDRRQQSLSSQDPEHRGLGGAEEGNGRCVVVLSGFRDGGPNGGLFAQTEERPRAEGGEDWCHFVRLFRQTPIRESLLVGED